MYASMKVYLKPVIKICVMCIISTVVFSMLLLKHSDNQEMESILDQQWAEETVNGIRAIKYRNRHKNRRGLHLSSSVNGLDIETVQGNLDGMPRMLSGSELRNFIATCTTKLPDAFIIGSPYCRTEVLAGFLNFHPNVSATAKKDGGRFFSNAFDRQLSWYKRRLPCSQPGKLLLEHSGTYFHSPNAPERLWRTHPRAKLVILVRDPIQRALSEFSKLISSASFEEYIFNTHENTTKLITDLPILTNSEYSMHLTRWLSHFPLEQIHITDVDAMEKNPYEEVSAVLHFLGFSSFREEQFVYRERRRCFCFRSIGRKGFHCFYSKKHDAVIHVRDNVTRILREFYKPFNELFYRQCGRHFTW